ncbi:hypothetical protein HPB49_021323 [Dermacentor silvarum]|uniref:Uncharacterized protein n=1 Tax=Dermacentor silvarum TaxID=543639 RepID=A0ACB8D853_DERSI|nr:hypothetical protein HPB49_021323 [Dermacentor silvarum]
MGSSEDEEPEEAEKSKECLAAHGYTVGKTLGAGSYSTVKLVSKGGATYACKIISKEKSSMIYRVKFLPRELKILGSTRHPHITQIFTIIEEPTKVFIIMEMACGGDLLEKILCCVSDKHNRHGCRRQRLRFASMASRSLANLIRPTRFTSALIKTPTMTTTPETTGLPSNCNDFSTSSDENDTMDASQCPLPSELSNGPAVPYAAAGSSDGRQRNTVYYRRQVSPKRLHVERETRGPRLLPGYRAFQTPTLRHKRQIPKGQSALLVRNDCSALPLNSTFLVSVLRIAKS